MGVDKPDVWIVSVSECHILCQICIKVLARAARQSEWDERGYLKSGYCKGVLFGKITTVQP